MPSDTVFESCVASIVNWVMVGHGELHAKYTSVNYRIVVDIRYFNVSSETSTNPTVKLGRYNA